jgi:molybdate transport system ATP-binding protein
MSRFDIDASLQRGDFRLEWKLQSDTRWLGLYGHSGGGKTTALELALGWANPDRGYVRIAGAAKATGYAPQDLLLFLHWTVEANLRAGELAGRTICSELFQEVVTAFDLESLLTRSARRLSGGEGRRVALARAILSAPKHGLLVLDEPLSSLDRDRRRLVLGLLLKLKSERTGSAIIVSHSAADLQVLCDEVQVLEAVEGRSTFGEPGKPAQLLAESGGFENILPAQVFSVSGDSALCQLEPRGGSALEVTAPGRGLGPGDTVLLGLRADDVLLTLDDPGRVSARNVLEGVVEEILPFASYRTLGVRLSKGNVGAPLFRTHITAGAIDDLELVIGSPVHLVFKTRSIAVLALAGR